MKDYRWALDGVSFVCNQGKRKTNTQKHGIDLVPASQAFTDPFAVNDFDPANSAEEDRFRIIGKMNNEILILVSYTIRHETVRIISARKAEYSEEKIYAEQ
jgi:uncharacterized DUF497 family protein